MSKPFQNFRDRLAAENVELALATRWGNVSRYIVRGSATFTTIVVIDGDDGFELFYESATVRIDRDVAALVARVNKGN